MSLKDYTNTIGNCNDLVLLLEKAIALGNLEARAKLANLLLNYREDIVINKKKAFVLVDEGTSLGCIHCQGMLALCYYRGYGCEIDQQRSQLLAHESAAKSSKYGQFVYGMLFHMGEGGLEQNNTEAFRWFQLAADQGHIESLYMVACCYEYGYGVTIDETKAIHWYMCAKIAGHSNSKIDLNRISVDNYTNAKNLIASGQYINAVHLLEKATNIGNLEARALLSWILIWGQSGVVKDHDKAFILVEEGMRLGCPHCLGILAFCYRFEIGCDENDWLALQLARKSSEKGSMYGQYVLGYMYQYPGALVIDDYNSYYPDMPDNAQAVKFYKLASDQGLDAAQCALGTMYNWGWGVSRDRNETLRLFQLAAAQKYPYALDKLENGLVFPQS